MRSKAFYKRGLKSAKHADIKLGDVVYFDNYQDGKYPYTRPMVSGPFTKVYGNGSGRSFSHRLGQWFMHYPENLLVPILTPDESRGRYLKIVKRLKKRFAFRVQLRFPSVVKIHHSLG
jgi:hypothetical protein